MTEVSTFRLYLLRAMYTLIAFAMGSGIWPRLISHEPWQQMEGVAFAMLGALSLTAVLGIRYPLQMLPLLLFELAWKVVWVLAVAWPQSQAGPLDPGNASTFLEVMFGIVILPLVLPWKYLFQHYVKKPGDRWRRKQAAPAASPVGHSVPV